MFPSALNFPLPLRQNKLVNNIIYSMRFTHLASQEAERSKFVVMKAEQEKRAAIIRAQGEAEAARLISEVRSLLV